MNANKTSETRYDWTQAPEWAQWAATDSSGEGWWYSISPELYEDGYWGIPKGLNESERKGVEAMGIPGRLHDCDWRDSLEQRPTLIAEAPESPAREGVTEALARVSQYVAAWDAKPIRGVDNEIHALHVGSEHEGRLLLSDIRALLAFLNARSQGGSAS